MSGREPRRDTKPKTEASAKLRSSKRSPSGKVEERPSEGEKKAGSDGKLYGGLAVVVAGLAGLVWWSLPDDHPPPVEGSSSEAGSGSVAAPEKSNATGVLQRPPQASAELAVVTDKPEDVVRKLATIAEIGKRLDVRHCGGACDAVRKFMSEKDDFEIDIVKTEDLILPPKDTMDTVAPGLTPSERDSVHARKTSVVVRTHGEITPEQMPARAAFAATAVLAEALDGVVYDEVSRRIETKHEVTSHTITAKLGEPVFTRKQIVVQLYRQDDGTARLLSLGMARLGSPDISLRGANMASGPMLTEVINAAASQIAHGKNDSTITVTLEDVARVVGKKPSDLNATPSATHPVVLDIGSPDRIEGDPDNEMIELVPKGGATRETWDGVVASLFGVSPSVSAKADDKELAEIAQKAQRDLPRAIKRFEAGEGELFVKGPFPIPPESRVDGGAATEMLWIAAASCDERLCTGVLSNEPSYATNIALGKTTSIKRTDAVDWLIQQRDGGIAGGESINVLKARSRK
jgi:uncharacterized protein YegJ (DUF2314 family)